MACNAVYGFVLLACIVTVIGQQITFFEPSSSVTITITEEISIGTVVLELPGYCGTISNWLKPLSYNVQISPSTYFNWNSTVEAIVVAGRLDRDSTSPGPGSTTTFTATVNSSDCSGIATLSVSVVLVDINDNAPVPVPLTAAQITKVTSTTPIGAQICVVSATDQDTGINAHHIYNLLQGGDVFSINPLTGLITLADQATYAAAPYTIVIEITDTGLPVQQSVTYTISVPFVISYGPPKFTRNIYVVTLDETLSTGSLPVTTVVATKSDPDPMATIVYSKFSDPSGLFSINSANGAVTMQGPLNAEINPQYIVIVQATLAISSPYTQYYCSGSVYSSYTAVEVLIRHTINQPPVCQHDVYFFPLPESISAGALVGSDMFAIDYDQGSSAGVTYSLISDTSAGTFQLSVVQNIVSLYLVNPVVYEALSVKTFVLMIRATDAGGLTCTMTVYIGIADVNNKPPVVQPDVYCIHESWTTRVTYCVPTAISVADVDTPAVNGAIVLSAIGDTRFSINASNHLCVHDLDYELQQVVNITVLAKDHGGVPPYNQGDAIFTINVVNDNDNTPYFVPIPSGAIRLRERTPHPNVLTLQVYDRDLSPYNNLCVTISDTSNNFAIVQRVLPTIGGNVTTVQLSVTTVLQYSFQHQWNITLSATDLGCNTDTFTTTSSILACSNTVSALTGIATVIIDVGCYRPPPNFTQTTYTGCVVENSANLTLVAPVSAADLHCNSRVTFAIQSQQVSAFAIDTTSGALSVVNPSLLDYESYPPNPHIISVTVIAWTDPDDLQGSVTSTATVLIEVLPFNEFAPVVTDVRVQNVSAQVLFNPPASVYYIPENKQCNILSPLMTLAASDADKYDLATGCNQNLPYYQLMSVTPAGRLTVTSSGQVMLTSCLDYSPLYINGGCPTGGDRNISVKVQVCDCQGTQSLVGCTGTISGTQQCSIYSFTIEVLDVNDNLPVITSNYPSCINVLEATPGGTAVTTITAVDCDFGTNAVIYYDILDVGTAGDRFTLNTFNGTITVTPGAVLEYEDLPNVFTFVVGAYNPTSPILASTNNVMVNICLVNIHNNPPTIRCPTEWTIAENDNSTLTGRIVATSVDTSVLGQLRYSIYVPSPIPATWFTIPDPTSPNIAVSGVDRESPYLLQIDGLGRAVVTINVTVTDGKFNDTCQFNVFIVDVNDNPPIFNFSIYTANVDECSRVGTTVLTVSATDADATPSNRVILYTITNGNTNNGFRLGEYSGIMETQQLLNYLVTMNYSLTLNARNPDGLSVAYYSVAAANITVIECNVHVPVFIGCPYQWTIYENTNTILTGVFATDANINSQYRTLRYSLNTSSALQPIPSTWFTLPDPYSPNITVTAVDRENITEADNNGLGIVVMTISVTDGKYNSSCQVVVLVVDENDNRPVFTPRNYSATILECSPIGTTVDVVYATDADATAINRVTVFTIVSGNPSDTFVLNNSTGVVTTNGLLNLCVTPSYVLTINVSNLDGLSSSVLATDYITVGCCNEYSPVFNFPLYNATVLEYNALVPLVCSQPAGALISVSATDGDCCPMYSTITGYSIIGGDPTGIFAVNSVGSVSVLHPTLFDYENTPSYMLTIAAMDGGSPPFSGITYVSVTVNAQHDKCPVFNNPIYTATVREDAPNGTILQIYPPITANEGDETSPKLSFSISDGPFNITADGTIVRTTIPVTYVQSFPYYVLTVYVTDLDIGRANTSTCAPYCNATAVVNITVIPINTRCVFTSDWSNYCPSLASYIPIGSVIKTVECVDTDLGLNGVVTYFLYGGDGYFAIDQNTGNITVANSLVNSVSAQYTITLVAQDLGSPPLTASVSMRFTVLLDRNPPYFTKTVFKGFVSTATPIGTTVLTVMATDDDFPLSPQGIIQYSIEPWTAPMPFAINTATGDVYVNSSLSGTGVQPFYVFLVKAIDGYCWQAVPDAIIEIDITNIPKPPCVFTPSYARTRTWLLYTANFSVQLWENATNGTLVIDLQLGSSSSLSTFSLITSSAGANDTFRVHSNGSIIVRNTVVRARPEYYIPAYSLTVAAQCGGIVNIITISIYVLDVNDHYPVVSNISYCIPEYTSIGTAVSQLTLIATDADLFENSYIVYSCVQPAPVFIETLTGVVTLNTTLNRLIIKQYPLVLCYATDRDGRGLATPVYFNITVCPYVNHPPYLDPDLQNMTVCELQTPGFLGNLVARDVDTVPPFNIIYYEFIDWAAYLDGKPSLAYINKTYPFFVVYSNGSVFTTAAVDRDITDQYQVTVRVSNSDTLSMKNISTIGTLVVDVCDINNHPPEINSSLVCIAQHPIIGTSITVLKASDRDVPNTPFSTVWFSIPDQTFGFAVDNKTGLVTTSGYNGAAGESVTMPVLAYDNYGSYISLTSTATLQVVVYHSCSQVVMTLCEPITIVEGFCRDLITGMLSGASGFDVCATNTEILGDSVQSQTNLYLYFYNNKTYEGLSATGALTLIDLNSDLLNYFQSVGCCIKDVKPYVCPTVPATAVPIWVPSSIAGLLALIMSMVCCVACIATSYWCRKYKKLKVTKSTLKRSLTSQLEQFSYQSEVNTTTNPLWVSPYDAESTVYESQELTIDMFQDDDDSSHTTEVIRPNQLYESQELVLDVFSDDVDVEPLVKNPPKAALYESQELKVDMFHDDFEPSTTKLPEQAPLYESQELKVDMFQDDMQDDPVPPPKKLAEKAAPMYESQELKVEMFHDDFEPSTTKLPAKAPLYESQSQGGFKDELKVEMFHDNAEFDIEPPPPKTQPKAQLYESQELKVDMFHDNAEFDLESVPSKRALTKADPLYESQELKVEMFHDNAEFDLESVPSKRALTKADPQYESQELKVEMFHDNTDFSLEPPPSKLPAKGDPLYESQELKVEMFSDLAEDDLEPLTVKKKTKTSKIAQSQNTTVTKVTSQKQLYAKTGSRGQIQVKAEDDLKSSSNSFKRTLALHSTPLHTVSDDDLLAQALDGGSDILIPK